MSDGFNRSLNALKDVSALDLELLRSKYIGVGSEYYDIVTDQLEKAATHATRVILAALAQNERESHD